MTELTEAVPGGSFCRAYAKQENVLAESSMMVPETRQRLEAALSDLQSYVVGVSSTAVAAVWQQAGLGRFKSMSPHLESLHCMIAAASMKGLGCQLDQAGSRACVDHAHTCCLHAC